MTTQQSDTTPDPERPKVSTFKPSSFQLTQFEALTEAPPIEQFKIAEWTSMEGGVKVVDPMFEVYDDLVNERSATEAVGADEKAPMEYGASGDEGFEEEHPTIQELRAALRQAVEDRKALQEDHEHQVEALKTSLNEEIRAEAQSEIKAIEERYAALIEDMNVQISEGISGVERRAVELAVHVAKKLVGTIVAINPEYVLEVIKEGVKLTGGATIKAIRVSPQDLEFLKLLTPEKQFKEFDGSWSFQADDTIRAGCIIETSSGEVEFDLDKAWERIKESVTKVR